MLSMFASACGYDLNIEKIRSALEAAGGLAMGEGFV
jgi:hypothetical protein